MIIEKIPLKLASLNLDQVKYSNEIIGLNKKRNFKLNPHQLQTLELIAQSKSIFQIVHYFLNAKIVPSFLAIRDLIGFLVEEDLLLNPELKPYFSFVESEPKSFLDEIIDKLTGENNSVNLAAEINNIPFFRSLEPGLKDIFVRNAKVVDTPENIAICSQGQMQSSLFAILKGEARVIKKDRLGRKQTVATLTAGSVFGEAGFFLGEARTADVITSTKCIVARFKYLPDLFDANLKTQTAKALQKRFWLIHALLKSDIFKELPQDCFDALLFAGTPVTFNPDQFVCTEGDTGDSCYLVIQGRLVVSQKGKSIRVLEQGDCFGEMALIVSQGRRTASVKAQTEVQAIEIRSDKFYDLMGENLFLACEFERLALERWQKDNQRSS